jgi:hypothetical protein
VNARAYQTATLLPDGQVLLAGGINLVANNSTSLASAELFNPKTGLFSPTGSMTDARYFDTATLLPDGRVLVVGGESDTQIFASAELYNPKTGTFSATGSMTTVRDEQTATLLADGRVLIAGGEDATGALASAEIYNPQTGKFTATGSMTTPRLLHSAILLPDGDVLIVGGYASEGDNPMDGTDTSIGSAELYNPKTGTFSATGSMTTELGMPTLTLLPDGRVLVAGGCLNNSGQSFAALYDPKTGTFTETSSMSPRCLQTATLLPDGEVLMAGGISVENQPPSLASAELYNPQTGTFSPTGSMTAARAGQTATLLPDGNVLIAGGDDGALEGGNSLASAELYNPQSGTFSPLSSR